uniref:Craniofacial development protein 1 n=1 Tax=Schistosoma haematobium TaxID=6185 RepID=A0A095C9M0_SCHHA
MSLSEDESTSDEEYIPPVKASKLEEDSESEYSDESESGDSDCISGKIIPSLDLALDSLTSQSSKKRPAKRVIQAVSNSNRTKGLGVSHNKTSTETIPLKPKAPSLGLGLTNALQNLKSTINSLPKLSTLEKSRLDWKQYVQKESLEDDLKAHNKGKEGYLERQAFFNRANEREYQYERQLRKSASSRKT